MNKRTLGRTGLQASPYCLGTMMFGGPMGEDPNSRKPCRPSAI